MGRYYGTFQGANTLDRYLVIYVTKQRTLISQTEPSFYLNYNSDKKSNRVGLKPNLSLT